MNLDTERSQQRPTRLLLVEDYGPLAEVTAILLRAAGLEVRIAESGEEALLAASVFRPEVVLCDLSLPDMSGLDVVRELRSNPDTKQSLLALHTGSPDMEIRQFQRESHLDEVNMFLSKPLTAEKIQKLLARLPALPRVDRPEQ